MIISKKALTDDIKKKDRDFLAQVVEDYPGITQPPYSWMDANNKEHEMAEMELIYLKNARNTIFRHIDGYKCNSPYKSVIECKVKEFDRVIQILQYLLKKNNPNISSTLADKSSLFDFGIETSWDIEAFTEI